MDPSCQEVDLATLVSDGRFLVEVLQPLDPDSPCSKPFDALNKDGDECGCLECGDFDCATIIQSGVVDILQKTKI